MGSMKNIKQRIANVSSTAQIIKAMDMVSSIKLQKERKQLEGVLPMQKELDRVADELGSLEETQSHIYYKEREVKNSLYVVLTSDRGLSGSYNANILKATLAHMNKGKNEKILVIGSKGDQFFRKHKKNIVRKIIDAPAAQSYYISESLSEWINDLYVSGEVDEVFIAFTKFENVLTQEPAIKKILPVATSEPKEQDANYKKYEPDVPTFIDHMIPLYLQITLFSTFSESYTSEQASRMVSMNTAGKNAEEIIEDLNVLYNKKRQDGITQELNEIVGSANIMNKGG